MPDNRKINLPPKQAHIIIPGVEAYYQYYNFEYSRTLNSFLKQSNKVAVEDDYYGLISALFAYDGDIPVAALKQQANVGSKQYYMCADPVYMQADRDQLLMFDSQDLAIELAEAEKIIQSLNSHFKDDGLNFLMINASQWVVRVAKFCRVKTNPLYHVVNRPVLDVLPSGEHSGKWKAIINEIQMLLYTHEVNDSRQDQGLKPINGVWLWGNGAWPDRLSECQANVTQVYTDENWLLNMAGIDQLSVYPIEEAGNLFMNPHHCSNGDTLYLNTRLSNEYGRLTSEQFKQSISDTEQKLWRPLKRQLGKVYDQINIYPGDGFCYTVKPGSLMSKVSTSIETFKNWLKRK